MSDLQVKGWPPPAYDEIKAKGGEKWAYASDWNFIDMMIATSPFGDGREWAKKIMGSGPQSSRTAAEKTLKVNAKIVAMKFGLAPKAILNWYEPYAGLVDIQKSNTRSTGPWRTTRRKSSPSGFGGLR